MQHIFDESFVLSLSEKQTNFELFNQIQSTLLENLEDAKFFYNINPQSIITINKKNYSQLSNVDAIIAPMFFHKVNNIDLVLQNVKTKLNKNGVLLGNFFGVSNLQSLGELLAEKDVKWCGQPLPRMLPLMDIKTIGGLLQKNGFSNAVVSSENITFEFKNLKEALYFLKQSGESNCLKARDKTFFSGNILKKYIESFQKSITLKFEVCFFSCLNT